MKGWIIALFFPLFIFKSVYAQEELDINLFPHDIIKRVLQGEEVLYKQFLKDIEQKDQDDPSVVKTLLHYTNYFLPLLKNLIENKEDLKKVVEERNASLKAIDHQILKPQVLEKIEDILTLSLDEKLKMGAYIYTLYYDTFPLQEKLFEIHQNYLIKWYFLLMNGLKEGALSDEDMLFLDAKLEWDMLNEMEKMCVSDPESIFAMQVRDAKALFSKVKPLEIEEFCLFSEKDVGTIMEHFIEHLGEKGLGAYLIINVFNGMVLAAAIEVPPFD